MVSRVTRLAASLALSTALLLPMIAGASGTVESGIGDQLIEAARGAGAERQEAQLEVVVARIINVSLSLIGIVLVALLVYAGWLWMTAAGEEEKITKAKGIIRSAIIGLIIVLAAYAISRFVIGRLIAATSNAGRL